MFLALVLCPAAGLTADNPRLETLPGDVEHWYHPGTTGNSPYLFQLLSRVYSLSVGEDLTPPFGKSAALLVGVSEYQYLDQLPSATNDLTIMRDLLLSKGRFDDVYIMKNEAVTRDRVELYVKRVLPNLVGFHGRILFYYSGHGGDENSKSGYMLFRNFKPGEFFGQSVLPLTLVEDWSTVSQVKHMLFLLDCCASGMLLMQKADSNEKAALLNTLSGHGSRTFITAGIDKRPAYATPDEVTGNSAFTKAFVASFNRPQNIPLSSGFVTITEIFGTTQIILADLSLKYHRKLNPRIRPVTDEEHDGTFVFINPDATSATLTDQEAEYLRVRLKSKGSDSTVA